MASEASDRRFAARGFAAWLARQARWRPTESAFWAACLLPYAVTPDYLQLASQIAIAALFALSLDLVLGYGGILSLGQAAFFGIGAYTAGLLAAHGWGEPLTGLVCAAAAAGLCGWLASFVVVRFNGLALIMITLGLAQMLASAANQASWLTGGVDGLQGVNMRPIFGLFDFDLWGRTAYGYSLAVLFLVFLLVRRIVHSPFGLSLRGIRDNGARMSALGAPKLAHLRTAFTLAAAIAGMSGGLLAQTTSTVALDSLSFQKSADVLVILVLGGVGRLYGGLVGAVVYMVARDRFSEMNPQYWYFWIGLLLILVVVFMPGGVVGGLADLARRRRAAK